MLFSLFRCFVVLLRFQRWLARRAGTGEVGFVPSNFFVADRLVELEEETNTTLSGAMERKRRNSRVLYNYRARTDNEVTVSKGDVIVMVEDDPTLEWTLIEVRGQRGYIPTNYLKRLAVEAASDQEQRSASRNSRSSRSSSSSSSSGAGSSVEGRRRSKDDDVGLTASVLGWQSSVSKMPTSVQGILQKKNLSPHEIERVREMMQMLITTPGTNTTGNQSTNNSKTFVKSLNEVSAVETNGELSRIEGDVMQWDCAKRQWSSGLLKLQGTDLICYSKALSEDGVVLWKLLLDSYCNIEKVRSPTTLDDLADDSSEDDEDEMDKNMLTKPPGVSSTLYCIGVSRYEESNNDASEGTSDQSVATFSQIFATRNMLDCDNWKVKIQSVVDSAMESELDQLMIFAEADGQPKSRSMLSSIASKARSVLSRGRDPRRVSLYFVHLFFSFFIYIYIYFEW